MYKPKKKFLRWSMKIHHRLLQQGIYTLEDFVRRMNRGQATHSFQSVNPTTFDIKIIDLTNLKQNLYEGIILEDPNEHSTRFYEISKYIVIIMLDKIRKGCNCSPCL